MNPIYRFDQPFEYNAAQGPAFTGELPVLPKSTLKQFLGLDVNGRFGIAAGPGINSRWTSLFGRLGFDILTYKTIRLVERLAHPVPNWLPLATGTPLADAGIAQCAEPSSPESTATASYCGSLGTPSLSPDFWQTDIERARQALGPGQILIVSVMGTATEHLSEQAFVAEYGKLAAMAAEAGAHIIEANLSCPNVVRQEGEVYLDVDMSRRVAAALQRGAPGLPILLKIGEMGGDIAPLLRAVAPHAQGVVMINALARQVLDANGQPAFGASRRQAGIYGAAIHDIALAAVRRSLEVIRREHLDLQVVGVGGACSPEQAGAFIDAGACAALSASAALCNPYLALQVKQQRPDI